MSRLSAGLQAEISPCQSCGACCSFSSDWPRFSTECDEELDRIPAALVNVRLSGMRCTGERCNALDGKVGAATRCTIYDIRPAVCRTCQPGDEECLMARRGWGLGELAIT